MTGREKNDTQKDVKKLPTQFVLYTFLVANYRLIVGTKLYFS